MESMENQLPVNSSPTLKNNPYFVIPVVLTIIALLVGIFIYSGVGKRAVETPKTEKPLKEEPLKVEPLMPLKAYDSNLQKGPFTCPIKGICSISKNYANQALTANFSSQTPILAAFDGTAEAMNSIHPVETACQKVKHYTPPDMLEKDPSLLESCKKQEVNEEKEEKFTSILLYNKEKGLLANYSFKGKVLFDKKEVREGEKIANATGEPIKYRDNKSFIFEMQKFGEKEASQLSLSGKDFR